MMSRQGDSEQQVYPNATKNLRVFRSVNKRVNRAEVICRETQEIAEETLDELAQQRESLGRIRDGVVNSNRELEEANKNLRRMYVRVFTSKLLLSLIIVFEIIIIVAQIYLKFIKSHKNKSNGNST
uniref:Vesicle transport through interaction with t-SNAREs 1B n=1 Tax=Aceria tosichella TaxID=561515 RepID=A0A6G1S4J5_9ACAR